MSYKEFWEDDPEIFWAYRFYFYKKQRDDIEMMNFNAWLNGMYTHYGVSLAISNSFRKQGTKSELYFEKPLNLFRANEDKEEEIKRQREAQEKMIKDRALRLQEILEKNKKEKVV